MNSFLLTILTGLLAISAYFNTQSTEISDIIKLKYRLLRSLCIFYDPITTPEFKFEWNETRDNYTISRFVICKCDSDQIPGYLLKPLKLKPPYPVMICLQGHSPGMHISIGAFQNENEAKKYPMRDIAIQAINNGWAALVIEQKGFGERSEGGASCQDLSLRELMSGRTMLGQRVSDVILAINFIETQADLDLELIGCMGNSAGGTTTYFAAAIDPRISLAVVSCSFSTYETSWLKYPHCACGFLPGILEVGDMPDFAELIAPRKLLIVAGKEDNIADIDGVREGFNIAKKSFEKAGVPQRIKLIEGNGGHQFYPDLAWPIIQQLMNQ